MHGALHWEFESTYLFLSRDHLEAYDTESAIEVGRSKKSDAPTDKQLTECTDSLVFIEGLVQRDASESYYIVITRVCVKDARRSKKRQKQADQSPGPTVPSKGGSP